MELYAVDNLTSIRGLEFDVLPIIFQLHAYFKLPNNLEVALLHHRLISHFSKYCSYVRGGMGWKDREKWDELTHDNSW